MTTDGILLRSRTILAAIIIFAIILFLDAAPGVAEIGLKLSPTHLTPTVAVGDETSEVITLQNESSEDMTIRSQVDFGQDSDEFRPAISIDPDEIRLRPGEAGKVNIKIVVPPRAAAGRRQAMALFNAIPASGRDIAIVGRVSSLVDIEVIHPVDEVEWCVPWIVDSSTPAHFIVEARNSGNFTTGLVEKVELQGLGGTEHLESPEKSVAVGESTRLEASWEDTPIFAIKKEIVSVGSGVGTPVEKKAWLIVFPWKLSLALLLIILASFAGFRAYRVAAKVFGGNWRQGQ